MFFCLSLQLGVKDEHLGRIFSLFPSIFLTEIEVLKVSTHCMWACIWDLGFSFGWVDVHNNRNKKECIPVWCMPPAFLVPWEDLPAPPWMQPPPDRRPPMEADPPICRSPSIPVNRHSGVKTLSCPKIRLRAVQILIIEINDSFCDWRFEMWSSSKLLG